MDLSLRKARKLEAKIQATADALPMSSTLKVRVLASTEERTTQLVQARDEYTAALDLQADLIAARFLIRDLISKANFLSGINSLMSQRELTQALLAKSTAGVEALDLAQAEDLAAARKASLEKGESSSFRETSVTMLLPVSTKADIAQFAQNDKNLKKALEDIEDQLSQKNVGIGITLDESTVTLLQSVGLL